MSMVKFNINQYVWIVLTQYGVDCIAENKGNPLIYFPLSLIDAKAGSKHQMQLHTLISSIGKFIGPSFSDTPFETTIEFDVMDIQVEGE